MMKSVNKHVLVVVVAVSPGGHEQGEADLAHGQDGQADVAVLGGRACWA